MENKPIMILDKGSIEVIDTMGTDLSVVNAARISYKKHYRLKKKLDIKDKDLLDHLVKNGHWTPLSHVVVTLHIKMPLFIARQWFKSQVGFSRNEISRRYTKDDADFYLPSYLSDDGKIDYLIDDMELHYEKSQRLYRKLIKAGVKKEQARIILPQSMYTEFVETASLAAYARLYKLRISKHAQWEIRQYAKGIDKLLNNIFPETWTVIKKYTPVD